MKDADCVEFLQWALPQLKMRWPGFRRVRAQACKRIQRRMKTLSCPDVQAYRFYLERHREEWTILDTLCRITITRFYRDRQVFRTLMREVLPDLGQAARARHARELRIWCAGCASGEEPYTLAVGWRLELAECFPDLTMDILATDADAGLLSRGAEACYAWSAVRNLPSNWLAEAFQVREGRYCLRAEFKTPVRFELHDLRSPLGESDFDLICCRNLAFTYFEEPLQLHVAEAIHDRMLAGGVLLLGVHERLPEGGPDFQIVSERLALYRKPPFPDGTSSR
ncbi:CheR family methyltransferase [Thiohalomonas denitrificans]|uniref:CheR family methyltransferase n=1 Tax=Thiohalomonas denitrificans TaxID=415747 RepID=UPI0026EF057F|nr:CheR family methyltransferase [Thiohalomonas denitrificans]